MPRTRPVQPTPLGDAEAFTPDSERPVRVRARSLAADTHFEPHRHPWAQLAYCASGIIQVNAQAPDEVTYIVPPTRAVWIAPGALHAVTALEAAEFRTLYIDATATPAGWAGCRVIVVSPLLRELVLALDAAPHTPREHWLTRLVIDELAAAATQTLGVPMPHRLNADRRLRMLCEAVLLEPTRHSVLANWAADTGASERTMARLFRDELGISWRQWRHQVLLAHALPMLARGDAVGHVAHASGYASESAFCAMFRTALGHPPSHFRRQAALPG